MRAPFEIAGEKIAPGERRVVEIPLSLLSNHTPVALPVHVIHGRREGPVLFVSAAIHGDEVIGVEIARRLVKSAYVRRPRGTLLIVPITNTYGFINHSRYLPDRRDLNRSFPGSAGGSLAAQLAQVFMKEIVSRADYGIDLHSGGLHRANLPQIRADLDDPETAELATAFGASIVLHARLRDGSLRQAAQEAGCKMLLYEAGEALRFNELGIRIGVKGVLSVMKRLGMTANKKLGASKARPSFSRSSYWLRSPAGGILRAYIGLGESVAADELLAVVSDAFGEHEARVTAQEPGIVIGRTNLPVVNQGDALFHIATVEDHEISGGRIERLEREIEQDPFFGEEDIV